MCARVTRGIARVSVNGRERECFLTDLCFLSLLGVRVLGSEMRRVWRELLAVSCQLGRATLLGATRDSNEVVQLVPRLAAAAENQHHSQDNKCRSLLLLLLPSTSTRDTQ
ncbi:hypothetical protein E2C01_084336 [Portunus trituberculatus]|uniref:Uncharacterized protein n=1 Tax=Portunus trituberculatus TaxID=210409 RepID=A0A5B7IV07_PORTR|nr:hypothetical protein [Portunus trituberculatus]